MSFYNDNESQQKRFVRRAAAAKRSVKRSLKATAILTLGLLSFAGCATTLEAVPGLEMSRPDRSTSATLKLFPVDGGNAPTHWIVTTSNGQTMEFSLWQLPTLHERNHVLYLRDLRVSRLQSARCSVVTDQPIRASRSAKKCVPVDVVILLNASTPRSSGDGHEGEAPRLTAVATTSEVGVAIARHVMKGGTVRMSLNLDTPTHRCRPERDLEC